MEIRVLSDGEETIGRVGNVVLRNPVPGVVLLRMSGNVTADMVPNQIKLLDRFHDAAPVPTDFFYDLWELQAYESMLRVDLTSWHIRHRSLLRSLHTATQSTIVRMGVTVANVALRVITQHEDLRSFEAAMAKAIEAKKTA